MPGYYQSNFSYGGTDYPVGSHFTQKGIYQQRSFVCSQCHVEFRRDQVKFYKGRVFGVPCGCHTDIYQLQRRERDTVWKGSMSNSTRQEDF
jgi:formate-dependent nitrite reductase cytochrome c552 subunit